jgi:hypothetical protein
VPDPVCKLVTLKNFIVKGGRMQDVWAIVSNLQSRGSKPTMMAAMKLMETTIKLAKVKCARAEDGAKVETWIKSWGGEPDVHFYTSLMDLRAKVAVQGICVHACM